MKFCNFGSLFAHLYSEPPQFNLIIEDGKNLNYEIMISSPSILSNALIKAIDDLDNHNDGYDKIFYHDDILVKLTNNANNVTLTFCTKNTKFSFFVEKDSLLFFANWLGESIS